MAEPAIAAIDSPIGELTVFATGRGVARIDFGRTAPPCEGGSAAARRNLAAAVKALGGYFAGEPAALDRLALDLPPLTPFRARVYEALRGIRFGETRSYRQLAALAGRPAAARAVGTAMARNPIPLVLPCHRVLASGGALGGYGPGLAVKERLLAHEGARSRAKSLRN